MTKKRLLGDIKLIKNDPHDFFEAVPREENMLIWNFLLKGPPDSDYTGGYYFGDILFTSEYPLKPPDFIMKTPNGRFEINKKICLSNTGFHTDTWSPMWNVNAMLNGFLSIMLDDKEDGLSHIHLSKEQRKTFAANSIEYNKKNYKSILDNFPRFLKENGDPNLTQSVKSASSKPAQVDKVDKVDKVDPASSKHTETKDMGLVTEKLEKLKIKEVAGEVVLTKKVKRVYKKKVKTVNS